MDRIFARAAFVVLLVASGSVALRRSVHGG